MRAIVFLIFILVSSSLKSQSYHTTFYDEESGLSQWHVTQMLQDHRGMMWFSTWNGLNRFDGKEFVAFKSKAGDGSSMSTNRIRDMILASNNDIFCRVDEKWYRFSQRDGRFYDLSAVVDRKLNAYHRRQTKYMHGQDGVFFKMYDRQHNEWRIMQDGILKLTPSHSSVKPVPNLGTPSQIRAFYQDRQGMIWISSRDNKCLYLFDSHLNFIKSVYVGVSAYVIHEDSKGNILLGCKPDGLFVGNENGFKPLMFDSATGHHPQWDIYDVLSVGHDQLLLATFQSLFSVQQQKVKNFLPSSEQELRFRKIFRKGNVVIGATTDGLFVGDLKSHKYSVHLKEANRTNSLSSSDCMNILEHQGHIFIATESGGVNEILNDNLLDQELRFRHFDSSNGLPSDIALSMVSLGDDILIVSSNQLMILNPQTGKSRSLGRHFLQRSCRFSEAMPLRLSDGRWLFGLQDGAITIDERALKGSNYRPYLALIGLTIENQSPLRQVDGMQSIVLDENERTLSLSFAALDYSDPEHIKYAYKMSDDADWHYLNNNRSISLPELRPGDYQLFIQSTNADGSWCGNIRELHIHVTPKFTETTWFDLLLLVVILSFLAAVVYIYYYIRHIKQQQKETLEAYLSLLQKNSPDAESGIMEPVQPQPVHSHLSEQDDAFMQRIVVFVDEHIGDADVGVNEMAAAAMMSKSNLTRKIKELTGITPADFLKEARIKRAGEMLRSSEKNISEIAYSCGFNDPKYFSRVFKATMGKSPSEYRE